MSKTTAMYRLLSRANERRHWTAKARLNRQERQLGWEMMLSMFSWRRPGLPLMITLTRIAPRRFDSDDNLPMAFKSLKDGICEYLGVDDRTHEITWRYAQEKGGKPRYYAVRVEVNTDRERAI